MIRNYLVFFLFLFILALFQGISQTVSAQFAAQQNIKKIGFERYYSRTDFLLASPGALRFGLYGFDNPALLHYQHQPDLAFHWTSDAFWGDVPNWGGFLALPGVSFGMISNDLPGITYREYRYAAGAGTDAAAAGMAISWFRGDTEPMDLKTNLTLGTLLRPARYLSVGLMGTSTIGWDYYEAVSEIAVRPMGSSILTLFSDYAVGQGDRDMLDGQWSAGAALEALPGIRITGRYLHDLGFTAGIQLSLGRAGLSYQAHRDSDGHHRYHSYGIRAGAMDRNVFDRYFRSERSYVEVDLKGSLPYQRYRFFDRRTTFLNTLDQIYKAAEDPAVSGLVINSTGMSLDQAKTWEVRKALDDFKATGKKVVVYVERGGMMTLHMASVADYVVMDPLGSMVITGFASGRTYLAELLTAVGIGVDEFREMEYKSAFEAFSRTDMSSAEREQLQTVIDGFYELIREEVTESRGLSVESFDALIDRGISLSPQDLVEAGLVDTLARYSDMDDIIEKLEGDPRDRISSDDLFAYNRPDDDRWGPTRKIAVLYAEGPTMNESGIRARTLAEELRKVRKDRSVKAVVLRSDSPGGDALASDLVAREIRKISEEKPVVVSMGSVAASGGYWISMYADTIVAVPNTITGSIGVISGWFWDDGLSRHLRLNSDHVSRGASADLLQGPALPLIGLGLPKRPLTDNEREGLINRMNDLYGDFVEFVAEGRGVEPDQIREVAEGRIWTGSDAQTRNLVDELGSLYAAIEIAREKAGLSPQDKVVITEGPEPQAFSLVQLLGGVRGQPPTLYTADEPVVEFLKIMMKHRGHPMVIMPMETMGWIFHLQQQDL